MILKARHHPFIYPFFNWYTRWKLSGKFHSVHISGDFDEQHLPVLLISNHISWWDGFWVNYLNLRVFKRKFHFMMLESQLKKYAFFNKTGGYSVKKGNRSILESLFYSAEILSDPGNIVLLFPQGKIQSIYSSTFLFEKGISKILELVKNRIQIMLIVNMIDYFSQPKPSLYMYFKEYKKENVDIQCLQDEYNHFYSSCIFDQKQKAIL